MAKEETKKNEGEENKKVENEETKTGPLDNTTEDTGKKDEGKKKGKEKKTVEVDAEKLDLILNKLESLEKDNVILKEAADKARLNRAEAAHSEGKLRKVVQIYILRDKIVVGWKTLVDEVYTDERGTIHEDQRVAYYLEGEKEPVEMTLVRFSRTRKLQKAEVTEETKNSDGQIIYKIVTADGKELSISPTFLN